MQTKAKLITRRNNINRVLLKWRSLFFGFVIFILLSNVHQVEGDLSIDIDDYMLHEVTIKPGITIELPITIMVPADFPYNTLVWVTVYDDSTNKILFQDKFESSIYDHYYPVPLQIPREGNYVFRCEATWGEKGRTVAFYETSTEGWTGTADNGTNYTTIAGLVVGLVALAKIGPTVLSRVRTRSKTDADGVIVEGPFTGALREDGIIHDKGQKGLPESIAEGKDYKNYGDSIRKYTFKPPWELDQIHKIADHIEDLPPGFHEDMKKKNWTNLDPRRRGAMMKTLTNIVADVYGISQKLQFYNDPSPTAHVGKYETYFDGNPGTLSLNLDSPEMKDPEQVLRTIIHEARHAYQDMIRDPDGTDFQRILHYNARPENYDVSTKDYVRFRKQILESDAYRAENDVMDEVKYRLSRTQRMMDALAGDVL